MRPARGLVRLDERIGDGREALLAPPINLAARQLAASQVDVRWATVAGQTLDGARVPFRLLTLVEAIVAMPRSVRGSVTVSQASSPQTEQLKRLVR